MKKLTLFGLFLLASLCLVSCGKKAFKDEYDCFLDMDEAREDARKNKKDILVFITSEGDDFISQAFMEDVVNTQDFDEQIGKDYTVYHVDFSQKSYEKTVVAPTATKKEQKIAARYDDLLQTGYQFAVILEVGYTPAIFRLTADGYIVSEIDYDSEILNVNDFKNLLSTYDDQSKNIKALFDATKKGSNLDKARAIDTFYNAIDPKYQTFLLDLVSKIPELDKNDETGLLSHYIFLTANQKAVKVYANGDIYGAVQEYLQASENPHVKDADKQDCYYMAAYILSSSGSEDYSVIVNYLQKALDAAPESDHASDIKDALEYYKHFTK